MSSGDRLHALDAVRAYALILGVFLHATMPFLEGLPLGYWVWTEPPSAVLTGVFWFIHIFRMSAFFLIAGLFARMVVERRGVAAFVRDRAKRIGVPLVIGLPIVLVSIGVAGIAGALLAGIDVESLFGGVRNPDDSDVEIPDGFFPWAHLWFLYYLLILYCLVLGIRALTNSLALRHALDRLTRFAFSGPQGAIVPAVPIGLYYFFDADWIVWTGLPGPYLLWPELGPIIGYGMPFTLGWLIHRQLAVLQTLGPRWQSLTVAAVLLALGAYIIAGPTPQWTPGGMQGVERLVFTALYMLGQWCAILAFVAIAVRFWSTASAVRRYLADSSYWLYLFHMTTLAFIQVLLGPFEWHWLLKYTISITFSMVVLLLSYHYLVRATFVGVLLNGRRHVRESLSSLLNIS